MVDMEKDDDLLSGSDDTDTGSADSVTYTKEEVNAIVSKRLARERSKMDKLSGGKDSKIAELESKFSSLEAILSKFSSTGVVSTTPKTAEPTLADVLKEHGLFGSKTEQPNTQQSSQIDRVVEKAILKSAKVQFKALGLSGDDLDDAVERLRLKKIDISDGDFDDDDLDDEVSRVYSRYYKNGETTKQDKQDKQQTTVKTGVKVGSGVDSNKDKPLSRQEKLALKFAK